MVDKAENLENQQSQAIKKSKRNLISQNENYSA